MRLANAAATIALVILALPLAASASVGWFSRYAADDYCTASQVVQVGLAGAQSNLYVNWSGRFAATLFITAIEFLGGINAVPWLTALTLVVWLGVSTWAVRQLTRASLVHAALLSAVLIYATVQVTADRPQDLYWQTGLITYVLPLLLATLFVGCVAALEPGPGPGVVLFVLALLAGGTSETFAAAAVTALTLAFVISVLTRNTRGPLLGAGLLGAVVALGIIAVAPGNEVRQEASARAPLSIALPQSIDFLRGWLRLTFARPHAIELALVFVIPLTLAAMSSPTRMRFRSAAVYAMCLALVLLACMLPAFYALDSNPPGRAQIIPEFALLASLGLAGWYVGAAMPPFRQLRILAMGVVAVLLVLGPGPVTRETVTTELPAARAYAATWDSLDHQVRTDRDQGVQSVTVRPLPSTGAVQNLDFIGADRADWLNECVAGYYRVSSIAASPGG